MQGMLKKAFSVKRIMIYTLVIIVTYFATTAYFAPYRRAAKAITYYYGSKGDVVITIQDKLKRWGYYSGSVDGVYGYQTYTAVKYFQSSNGLTADGVVGSATLAALGINQGST